MKDGNQRGQSCPMPLVMVKNEERWLLTFTNVYGVEYKLPIQNVIVGTWPMWDMVPLMNSQSTQSNCLLSINEQHMHQEGTRCGGD